MKQGMHWIILWSLLTFVALVIFSYYDLEAAIYALPHKKSQFGNFIQYWGRKPLTVLIIAAGYLLADKKMRNKKKTLSRIASALCVHVVLHSALIVNLLKLFVGRPRPITLDSSGDGFVAFFDCSPGLGDFSFPSGHTAIAMSLAPLIYLFYILKDRKNLILSSSVTVFWAGMVAYGRVIGCAHYLTDTVFSVGSAMIFAPLSLGIGDIFLAWLNNEKIIDKCAENPLNIEKDDEY